MITHSSFPNLHGPRLEHKGGAAYIHDSTATFTDSSFGSNSAVRCVCCDTNVLGKIFKHSTYAWARAQASLVTSSRPHHTLAVMPTHMLMHTPLLLLTRSFTPPTLLPTRWSCQPCVHTGGVPWRSGAGTICNYDLGLHTCSIGVFVSCSL